MAEKSTHVIVVVSVPALTNGAGSILSISPLKMIQLSPLIASATLLDGLTKLVAAQGAADPLAKLPLVRTFAPPFLVRLTLRYSINVAFDPPLCCPTTLGSTLVLLAV